VSEFSAYEDYKTIREYQRAHDGRLPGGTKEEMAALEAQDCQTLVEAMWEVGAYTYPVELATPAARLVTWAYVDYLWEEIGPAGVPADKAAPARWIDMEQMRRTA